MDLVAESLTGSSNGVFREGRLNYRAVQIRFEKCLGSAATLYGPLPFPCHWERWTGLGPTTRRKTPHSGNHFRWNRFPFLVIPTAAERFRGPLLETLHTMLKQNRVRRDRLNLAHSTVLGGHWRDENQVGRRRRGREEVDWANITFVPSLPGLDPFPVAYPALTCRALDCPVPAGLIFQSAGPDACSRARSGRRCRSPGCRRCRSGPSSAAPVRSWVSS
jgi:hypothetical protein